MAKPLPSSDYSKPNAETVPVEPPRPQGSPPDLPPQPTAPRPAGTPPRPTETPPAPPVETPAPPVPTSTTQAPPCCCKLILWLDEIRVETLTDAGSVPGLADLLGFLSSDHVFVGASDGSGNTVTYPDDPNGIKLDEGEHAGDMLLFTLDSDRANRCAIEREIKIFLSKGSRLNKILDAIQALTAEIARITAEIARDSQSYQAAMSLLPPDLAAAAQLAAKILANQQNLTSLTSKLADLLKILTGTDDTLMDQFSVFIAGELPCEGEDWLGALKEPQGWKWQDEKKDRAILERRIERLGGVWHIRLAARRLCPPGHD